MEITISDRERSHITSAAEGGGGCQMLTTADKVERVVKMLKSAKPFQISNTSGLFWVVQSLTVFLNEDIITFQLFVLK